MKKILGLLLAMSSVFSMQLDIVKVHAIQERVSNFNDVKKVQINPASVFVPEKFGSLELYHGKKGFAVVQDKKKYKIQKCFTDPLVRDINKEKLNAFLQAGYLSVNKMNDGEFSLKAKGRLLGAGPIGATVGCWLGKIAVSVAGHGAIQLVAIASGPAYFVTLIALESTLGAAIEATSMAGALAGGIALGVATGPL